MEDEEESPFHWLEGDSLAPPCQTDTQVIAAMMDTIDPFIRARDIPHVVYDLGCGDGRICIAATERFGCRSVGVEIEEVLVKKFRANVASRGLGDRVQALQGDLLEVDLSSATVIFLYLLPEAIVLIQDRLEAALRRGAVLVCNTWGPKTLRAVQTRDCGEFLGVRLHVYTQESCNSTQI